MSNIVGKFFIKGLARKTFSLDNSFDVYLTDNQLSENDLILGNYITNIQKNYKLVKIGKVNKLNLESLNDITRLPSENYYESLAQIPASAYIFSTYCPRKCMLKNDFEYEQFISKNPDEYVKDSSDFQPSDTFNSEYWNDNYGFAENYSSDEYDTYNIEKHTLSENLEVLSAVDCSFSAAGEINKSVNGKGCLIAFKNMPLLYFDFDRKHVARSTDTMIVNFSPNGMIEVK